MYLVCTSLILVAMGIMGHVCMDHQLEHSYGLHAQVYQMI